MKPPLWRITYRRPRERFPVLRYVQDEDRARRLLRDLRNAGIPAPRLERIR